MKRSRPIATAAVAALAALGAAIGTVGVGSPASAEAGGTQLQARQNVGPQGPIGRPISSTVRGGRPARGARTVPTFETSFDFGGTTYPLTIVGTDPARNASTTTVPTVIVPLRVEFPDGSVFDGSRRVSQVLASPLFQPADFITGHTQFGDAFQRAQFWSPVSTHGGGYHVLLGQPTVVPSVTVRVPKAQAVVGSANGVKYGLVGGQWFFGVTQELLGRLHLDPASLPILLSDAVYLYYPPDVSVCCVVGFHGTLSSGAAAGQGSQAVLTVVWASWDYPEHFGNGNDLGGKRVGGDVESLSHEIAEWYNAPFADNEAPPWTSPLAPQYGCSNWFEVADPLVAQDFEVDGFHLQDAAFKSWFSHDVPSEAYEGRYSFQGILTEPSTLC